MSTDFSWGHLMAEFKEFVAEYPADIVAIGGIAVYLHTERLLHSELMESSHDVDFLVSMDAMTKIRDTNEVTDNRRLGKSQLVNHGVEYAVYVAHNNNLVIPYQDISRAAVEIDGVRCAALEHLLVLKCEAAKDRAFSKKGEKDLRDLAKIGMMLSLERSGLSQPPTDFWKPEYNKILQQVGSSKVFLQLAKNNAKLAADWRRVHAKWSKAFLTTVGHSGGAAGPRADKGGAR